MRKFIALPMTLLVPAIAFADRYGIDEAISDGGALPSWLVPAAFVALLVYHLHDHSRLDGERALESHRRQQALKELSEARKNLADAKRELDEMKTRYTGLHTGVQRYFEGVITDEEFALAAEPYLDPIEYTVYKGSEG